MSTNAVNHIANAVYPFCCQLLLWRVTIRNMQHSGYHCQKNKLYYKSTIKLNVKRSMWNDQCWTINLKTINVTQSTWHNYCHTINVTQSLWTQSIRKQFDTINVKQSIWKQSTSNSECENKCERNNVKTINVKTIIVRNNQCEKINVTTIIVRNNQCENNQCAYF